ncbi:hypothetical protein BH10BAC4_BH10BAC4_20770 [soil metagenome]
MATNRYSKFLWLAALVLTISNCVEPYQLPVSKETVNILVVDGLINATDNSAKVRLSRAISLSQAPVYPAELKASVSVESEDGNKYSLLEKPGGNYELTGQSWNALKKYRLLIATQNGQQYKSDYIEIKQSPQLDTVAWNAESDGTTIYANAHDATGKVDYYKWNYTETFEYNAHFGSYYKLVNGVPILRAQSEYIYKCWRTDPSSRILIGSSIQLTQNVVSHYPLTFLPLGTEKLSEKYSILVRVRGISVDEYNYWQLLQKTTENLGGLFDPLPTQVTGNMHNTTNSSESVLGYFSGGYIQEKRIYISPNDLPDYLRRVDPSGCRQDTIPNARLSGLGNSVLLIGSYGVPVTLGYLSSTPNCIDCRLAGGTTIKPDFWP